SAAGVHLRLTALFGNAPDAGSFMRALLHVDAHDLTFTDEPDGKHKTEVDVYAIAFGDNGQALGESGRTQTLHLSDDTYRKALAAGLTYSFNVPIKKPGAYQFRMAVRDAATERIGSASQFIEVPDINKQRLTLSGLVVRGLTQTEARAEETRAAATTSGAQATPPVATAAQPEGALPEHDPLAGPAVRRLRQGIYLDYAYVIYNARADKTTQLSQLTVQARLFRDGQPVFTGQPLPVQLKPQADPRRIGMGGRMLLGTDLPPGEYVLQVVVTDALADRK